MPKHQQADLDWKDGTIPVSRQFDDPYYSLDNGWEETAHVFLAGNDLPARLTPGFHVAELGFGTGLNLLALLDCALRNDITGPIRFTSFEAFPMSAADTAAALRAFPRAEALAAPLLEARAAGKTQWQMGPIDVTLILGDARQTLPRWETRADAWFLDGFAPAKNPELWDPTLLDQVARHTNPSGSFATYTAAGAVRQALDAAGFEVTRVPGFGRKRHMSIGTLRPRA